MGNCKTVKDFATGALDVKRCPVCGQKNSHVDWHVEYSGQGLAEYAELVQQFACACGHGWHTWQRIGHCWLGRGCDVRILYPSEWMLEDFDMLTQAGFVPLSWGEVVRDIR